jgi:2C-methyl-D-erythritol 2,4-cyclodiphosphate synthase
VCVRPQISALSASAADRATPQENIRKNLCAMLKAHPSVINIKAKTHEKVDSLGEERSIGCHAVVMLIRNA